MTFCGGDTNVKAKWLFALMLTASAGCNYGGSAGTGPLPPNIAGTWQYTESWYGLYYPCTMKATLHISQPTPSGYSYNFSGTVTNQSVDCVSQTGHEPLGGATAFPGTIFPSDPGYGP